MILSSFSESHQIFEVVDQKGGDDVFLEALNEALELKFFTAQGHGEHVDPAPALVGDFGTVDLDAEPGKAMRDFV